MIEHLKPIEILGVVVGFLVLSYILFAQAWIALADAGMEPTWRVVTILVSLHLTVIIISIFIW